MTVNNRQRFFIRLIQLRGARKLPFISIFRATEKRMDPCLNCNEKTVDGARYCHHCGQQILGKKLRMNTFLHQFMNDYFTFDSKFFKSVFPLLIRPGHLTNEFLAGRRVRYITPLRLYIFISIVFFLLLGFGGSEDATEDVDKLVGVYFPRLFFLLLPVFAGILNLLHITTHKNYVVHFIFAAHFHAFLFLSGILYIGISELFEALHLIVVNQVIALVVLAAYLVYLFVAMLKVYRQKIGFVVLKFLALLLIYGVVLSAVSLITLYIITQSG